MTNPTQRAVIVGGSSGIGLAAARRLLADGFLVTIAGRDAARLAAAKTELAGGDRLDTLAFDAAAPGAAEAAFGRIGAFDHLVLALGSRRGLGPFTGLDLADVRAGFDEKVWPHLALAQIAARTMRRAPDHDGSITFVAAVSGQMAAPGTAGIAAANGALAVVTPILAAELKPIRVNAVSPGVIDTPWWDFLPADQRRSLFADFAARTPAGRIGRPDDVAQAIAFLVANSFMTGHVLVCDGGLRLAA